MDLKLFVYNVKGYHEVFVNVENIYIKRVNNIKQLEISLLNESKKTLIPLKDIKLCYMIDLKCLYKGGYREVFRYKKGD